MTELRALVAVVNFYYRSVKGHAQAKVVSLHPLTFHEAIKHLVAVDPDRIGLTPKRRKERVKAKSKANQAIK